MASTEYDGQALLTSIHPDGGETDAVEAHQLCTDLGAARGASDAIVAQQLLSESDAKPWYFKMRGIDSSAGYTTWIVKGTPDPNGAQATRFNTTPVLTGAIVAGSGIVLAKWGGVNPDGSG